VYENQLLLHGSVWRRCYQLIDDWNTVPSYTYRRTVHERIEFELIINGQSPKPSVLSAGSERGRFNQLLGVKNKKTRGSSI
jgi:hypothetical protein